MARNAFYSFHFTPDNWRAGQVRQMGVLEGNEPCSDNAWEEVKKGGDTAIQNWIDGQMKGRSVAIVLIGQNTSGRKWINYEINKAWKDGKGVLGIYVHNLKNVQGQQSSKGASPFASTSTIKTYDPPYSDSKQVYDYIKSYLSGWIEAAIKARE